MPRIVTSPPGVRERVDPQLITLEAIHPGGGASFPDGFIHRKFAPCLIVAQAVRGAYEVSDDRRHGVARDGGVFLAATGTPLTIVHRHRDGAMQARWLHLTVRLLGVADLSQLIDLPLVVDGAPAAALGEGIGRLLAIDTGPGPLPLDALVQRQELALAVLRQVVALAPLNAQGRALLEHRGELEPVLAFVAGHLAEPLPPARLAAAAGLSRTRLFALFQERLGTTPMAYVERARIHRACQELMRGDDALAAVAARTGFANAFHFSRRFRAATGMPPSRFRADHRRRMV